MRAGVSTCWLEKANGRSSTNSIAYFIEVLINPLRKLTCHFSWQEEHRPSSAIIDPPFPILLNVGDGDGCIFDLRPLARMLIFHRQDSVVAKADSRKINEAYRSAKQ